MINTFFSQGNLASAAAMLTAGIIGFFFGLFLEKAGFGNSKCLAGIFYFRDMRVLKVMFSAVITAAIGFGFCAGFGIISPDSVYLLKTVYFVQIAGGLLLGIGFALGGWCPGTGMVGIAGGSIDALLFILGAAGGSILYNELYPRLGNILEIGSCGVRFAYADLEMSRPLFVTLFTIIGVCCFWGSELLEKKRFGKGEYFNSPFLKAYSLVLIASAAALFIFASPATSGETITERLSRAASEADHISAAELAERVMNGDQSLLLIDVRPAASFEKFHIKNALNCPLEKLPALKSKMKLYQTAVLYSDGAAHAVQGQMLLEQEGLNNILVLNGGLNEFINTCLKPISLRSAPVAAAAAEKIVRWRKFFTADN